MRIEYLDLNDYVAIAVEITSLDTTTIIKASRLDLADSALHAPSAGFGTDDFYPDFVDKAAVLIVRLAPTTGHDPFPNSRNPFPPARVAPGQPGFLHAPRGRGLQNTWRKTRCGARIGRTFSSHCVGRGRQLAPRGPRLVHSACWDALKPPGLRRWWFRRRVSVIGQNEPSPTQPILIADLAALT